MLVLGLTVYILYALGVAIASPFIILLSNDKAALSNAFDSPSNFLGKTLSAVAEIWARWVNGFR